MKYLNMPLLVSESALYYMFIDYKVDSTKRINWVENA